MKYTLKFERVGRNHHVPDLVLEATGAQDLAEQAYRPVGRHLGSREWDIAVNLEAMTGTIGMGRFGSFTVETDWEDNTGFWEDGAPSMILERNGFTAHVRDERNTQPTGVPQEGMFHYSVIDDRGEGHRVESGIAPTLEAAQGHAAHRIVWAYEKLVAAG